jgi:hypothetical protein
MSDQPTKSLSLGSLAYAAIVAAGAWLRLARLDWPPLTDGEAVRALAAAAGTPRPSAFWSALPPTDPVYSAWTSVLLQLLGSKDFVVRIIPAIAGIGVLLLPWMLRKRFGMGAALVAACLLAVSPVMLAASRTAGGGSLAVLGGFLALACVFGADAHPIPKARLGLAAVAAGLGAASSPSILTWLIGIALALGLARLVSRSMSLPRPDFAVLKGSGWMLLLAIGAAVAFAVALGAYPMGLAGLGEEISGWLAGWRSGGPFGPLNLWAAFFVYEPLVLITGLAGVWFGVRAREPWVQSLAMLSLGSALVIAVYPGHTLEDLQWLVVPMALMGGMAIAGFIEGLVVSESRPTVAALASVLLILLAFGYIQLATYARGLSPNMNLDPGLRLWLAIAAVALGAFVCVLFGLGWSWRMASQAAAIATGLALVAASVSMAWDISLGPSAASARQLWRSSATTPVSASLLTTLHGVSQAKTGRTDALPVLVDGTASPALAWVLREFPAAHQGAGAEQPAVIVMRPQAQSPSLGADYVGQTVMLGERWGWDSPLPPGPLAWWVTRLAPTVGDSWLLLVRADLASFGDLPAQPIQPASP